MTQVNIISPINIGSPTFEKERKDRKKTSATSSRKNVQEKTFKRIVQEKKKNVQEKRQNFSECFKRALLATNRTKAVNHCWMIAPFLTTSAVRRETLPSPRHANIRNGTHKVNTMNNNPYLLQEKKEKIEQYHCGKCRRERQQENRCALNKGNTV